MSISQDAQERQNIRFHRNLALLKQEKTEKESWSQDEIEDIVDERLKPMQERVESLETMFRSLLKAHVPALTNGGEASKDEKEK